MRKHLSLFQIYLAGNSSEIFMTLMLDLICDIKEFLAKLQRYLLNP